MTKQERILKELLSSLRSVHSMSEDLPHITFTNEDVSGLRTLKNQLDQCAHDISYLIGYIDAKGTK